jgi:hypothetical protein
LVERALADIPRALAPGVDPDFREGIRRYYDAGPHYENSEYSNAIASLDGAIADLSSAIRRHPHNAMG